MRPAASGVLYGIAAYGWWGLVPLYFKTLTSVDATEQLAHRVLWSLGLLALLLTAFRRWGDLFTKLRDRALMRILAVSTVLIGLNWFVFIYGVSTERVLHTSLGYFILPLVSVLLGNLFFQERLRGVQGLAVLLAGTGVLILVILAGHLPWISLALAISFGLYGMLRKLAPVDGLIGLTIETLLLLPVATGYLLYRAEQGTLAWRAFDLPTDYLLMASGIVTAVPLICFAQAARRLPLTSLGFLQYLSPTISFLLAVLVFHEPFSRPQLLSFLCIWAGLAVFVGEALHREWRKRPADRP